MRMMALGLLVVLAGCGAGSPEGVAREFLRESAEGNWQNVGAMVTEACASGPVAHGAPVQWRGMTVRPDRLEVRVVSQTEEAATIAYEIEGDASSGADFDVRGGAVAEETRRREPARRSGNLSLVKVDGEWRVSCP